MGYELEKSIDFLFMMAIKKCGNPDDARDLVQDTLLSALSYLKSGREICDLRAFLSSVLNRRFYDRLRDKYKLPVVYEGNVPEIACELGSYDAIFASDEAEQLRRQIAYLAGIYREVIVRHYMNGESVESIAIALDIPIGTVKSRLSAGRAKIRKGLDLMEGYVKQSYEPVLLNISNSGNRGLDGEPQSLIKGDLIAQNLLYLAYMEPVTEGELAKAIGIPPAYIEPIVKKLVEGELMKREGTRLYTDFLISTVGDMEQHIPAQKELAENNFGLFWEPVRAKLEELRQEDYYTRLKGSQRQALELYFFFNVYDHGIFEAVSKIYETNQIFPDRPNGGRWIAFGGVYPKDFDLKKHMELYSHLYAGERRTYLENYMGRNRLELCVYDPSGFPGKVYFRGEYGIFDDELIKLLFVIHKGIKPEETGFNTELLKRIPWLCECRILRMENGKPYLDIPVLAENEMKRLRLICREATEALVGGISELLKEFLSGKKHPVPRHLKSVPLHKKYLSALNSLLFALLRLAMEKGFILDEGYDDELAQCPCPMVFALDDQMPVSG